MRVIGLTGGIATGKSTVTQMLRDKGAEVIDADVVAREVVAPGTGGLADVAARFPGVLDSNGELDRARLAERIFGNETERRALNALTHPRIAARVIELTAGLAARGVGFAIYDAALLIENRLHEALDGVILVVTDPDTQRRRLIERNALSPEDADRRIAAQMPLSEKRQHATWVIDNSGTKEATRAQLDAIWPELAGAGRKSLPVA